MRDELRRQLSRRRTLVLLASAIVIPLGLAAIFAVRGAPELASGANPQLLNLAAGSALAFTIFSLYMCGPLLMIAIAAAFAGDALASEASWGTLRYLLAAPIPRRRLLARKLTSALLLSALALALLLITSLAAGLIAFGWHPLDTPTGGVLPAADGLVRLLIAVAYVFVTLVPFAVLALLFATMLDTPLAAVGIAAGVAVVSQMVDVIPTLGAARSLLPTHFQLAWTDLFIDPPVPDDLAKGVLQATVYSLLAGIAAWWRFATRDITS